MRKSGLGNHVSVDEPASKPASSVAELWRLGLQPYVPVWQAMRAATEASVAARRRAAGVPVASTGCNGCDAPVPRQQIWTVEHSPVFTLGRNARQAALLDAGAIPVVRVDRGGQVTLHAPGQLVVYLLCELSDLGFGVRSLVERIEQAMIDTAARFGCDAQRRAAAPGIYVDGAKLGALGLRVTRGRTLHGLSFNVAPRLSLFARMHPCGYADLTTTSLHQQGIEVDLRRVECVLLDQLGVRLGIELLSRPGLPAELLRIQASGGRSGPANCLGAPTVKRPS